MDGYIPPIHDCTPYHMQAIAALLKTGQSEPQMPKDDRMTTGKLIWYVAPIRPVMQMKVPEMKYPIQTQSHDCHQDSPPMIMEEDIIHVFYSPLVDDVEEWPIETHNVEAVGDPEAHKIPGAPLTALRFDYHTTLEQ